MSPTNCSDSGTRSRQYDSIIWLVGGIPTPQKTMSSSIGIMKCSIYGKITFIFQSTNQIIINPPLLNYYKHYISITITTITIIMANLRYSSNQSPGKSSIAGISQPLLWTDRASRFWLDYIRDVSIKNWRAMSVYIYVLYILYQLEPT